MVKHTSVGTTIETVNEKFENSFFELQTDSHHRKKSGVNDVDAKKSSTMSSNWNSDIAMGEDDARKGRERERGKEKNYTNATEREEEGENREATEREKVTFYNKDTQTPKKSKLKDHIRNVKNLSPT